jgi:hypothetical protein
VYMNDWECTLCGEKVPASEIISMNHYRLMHPDTDVSIEGGTWPDGGLIYFEDPDEDPGTFI